MYHLHPCGPVAKWHEGDKRKRHPDVTAYIADLEPPQKAIVEAIRRIVKEEVPDAVEGIAYGVPFWFARDPLCYASAAKNHITLGMARGMEIEDRFGLLTGTGKSPIRKCVVKLKTGLNPVALREWLRLAVKLPEDG